MHRITYVFGIHYFIGVFIFKSYLAKIFTRDECIIVGAASTLFITAVYENFDGSRKIEGNIEGVWTSEYRIYH